MLVATKKVKDPSVEALVSAYRPHEKIADEIVRLLASGGCDPGTVRLNVVIKVALENIASEIPVPSGSAAYEEYDNLRKF